VDATQFNQGGNPIGTFRLITAASIFPLQPCAGDNFKLMHCVPSLPPGRLVAVPGAGLLRVPHVDPALMAEKAAAEADSSLAKKGLAHIQKAGVSSVQKLLGGGGC
jgi:hypothetical protein